MSLLILRVSVANLQRQASLFILLALLLIAAVIALVLGIALLPALRCFSLLLNQPHLIHIRLQGLLDFLLRTPALVPSKIRLRHLIKELAASQDERI